MMKRVFLAFSPPQNIVSALKKYYDESLQVRWTNPQNLHVTLKFIGDVEEKRLRELSEVVEKTTRLHLPVLIHLEKIIPMKHMIWVTVQQNTAMDKLYQSLNGKLKNADFVSAEDHRFRPHINLARSNQEVIWDEVPVQNLNHLEFTADRVVLFESILRPEGPTYISLGAFALSQN